ncbi:MAG TPA: Ig-like domain-containing protein [Planctomycetota bacterium]|jgi:hypothetical protein|nr:Ig-like domain-containing protein [Planctomycetota bacterium]
MVPSHPRRVVAGLFLGLLSLPACGGGGGGGGGGGSGGGLGLLEVRWGRVAEIRDAAQNLVAREKVVEEGIQNDLLSYEVTTNAITGTTTVRILSSQGTPPFDAAFAALDDQLGFVVPKTVTSPPPYSMVPRNAVALLRFNQPVKANSITPQTIRVFEGVPAQQQVEVLLRLDPSDARNVIVEPTVSALQSELTGLAVNAFGFPPATTTVTPNLQLRIPTVKDPASGQTTLLRAASGSSPEDDDPSDGPDLVRTFRSGGATAATGDPNNGFVLDLVPPTIVGVQSVTVCGVSPVSDLRRQLSIGFANGNCVVAPEVGDVVKQGTALGLVVGTTGSISPCAPPSFPIPQVLVELISFDGDGDAIELGTGAAEYNLPFKQTDIPGCFVTFIPEPTSPGGGAPAGVDPLSVARVRFSEPMDPDSVRPFDTLTLTLSAPPVGGVDALPPNAFVVGDLSSSADLKEFTFVPSLPIPHAANGSESRHVRVTTGLSGVRDLSGNALAISAFDFDFSLSPTAPAASTGGFALRFNALNETDFNLGPADLAGSPPTAEAGKPDYGGQVVLDAVKKELRGRPVARFSKAADTGNAFVGGAPTQWPFPILTPLTSFGSRLMTCVRHVDVGFSGGEKNEMNLDVEGMAWSPFQITQFPVAPPPGSGAPNIVTADTLPRFKIELAHSYYFPDEMLDLESNLAVFGNSGLDCSKFNPTLVPTGGPSGNPVGGIGNPFYFWFWNSDPAVGPVGVTGQTYPEESPPAPPAGYRTVCDASPYVINPVDLFQAPSGRFFLPYPPFQNTYTWRDSGFPFARKGAPNGNGVEPGRWSQVLPPPTPAFYGAGQVPSVALPLLVQCKSYPPSGPSSTLNVNGLQISLMINSSIIPNFRLFTTGGFNTSGTLVQRNPDNGNIPLGGFNPNSTPPGQATGAPGQTGTCGPEFYWANLDFVVRVTRSFTHWFDLGAPSVVGAPIFATPVAEPRGGDQPAGTKVLVEYRGATTVSGTCAATPPTCDPLTDASKANIYGIYILGTGTPPNQGLSTQITGVVPPFATGNQASVLPEWTPDITRLNGKRYLQMRFTFVNNIATGEVPTLSSLGVAFVR